MSIREQLIRSLSGFTRLAVIGIGNEMRGDDGVGLYIIEALMGKAQNSKHKIQNKFEMANKSQTKNKHRDAGNERRAISDKQSIHFLIGGTTPENLTGTLKRMRPSHVLFIDAADFDGKPGEIRLIEPKEADGMGFSTHSFPMSMLCKYISDETGATCLLIGIKPKDLSHEGMLSESVKQSAEAVINNISLLF